MKDTKLTDFSYPELVWMSAIVSTQVNELTERVQYIQGNPEFLGEDLLIFFANRLEYARTWYAQIEAAMIEIKMEEIVKSN